MSNITVKEKVVGLQKILDSRMLAIAKSLPASVMTADRFARVVLTVVQRNPYLLEVNQASLIGAIMQAAHLGLDCDISMGQAYFVPFKGVVQFIPGYRGLITLAYRSGQMSKIGAREVRSKDSFSYSFGTDDQLKHIPLSTLDEPITHAYAYARLLGSADTMFEVMTYEEIESIRKRSPAARSGKSTPWITDYAMMARKTVLRRLCKILPASTEQSQPLGRAMDLDERAEIGLKQHIQFEGITDESETEDETEGLAPTEQSGGLTDSERAGKK